MLQETQLGEGGSSAATPSNGRINSNSSSSSFRTIYACTSASTSEEGPIQTPQSSAAGGLWKSLFRAARSGNKSVSNEQQQNEQQPVNDGPSSAFGTIGEVRRRFMRHERKDADGAGTLRKPAVPSISTRRLRASSSGPTEPDSVGTLCTSRSVRFGPTEIREFSPQRDVRSSRRAKTVVCFLDEVEASPSRPTSFVDFDCDGVPSFLRRDLAAAAAASGAAPSRPERAGHTMLPTGLSLDQAITFGHGQFASKSPSSPRNNDSHVIDDFIKVTGSDPAVAKAAEDVVSGWCA